jgi:P-type Ca2+ transporter type 2C
MAAVALATGVAAKASGGPWQSMILVTITLQQLCLAVVLRSSRRSVLSVGLRGNPLLLWSIVVNVGLLLLAVTWGPLMTLLSTERLTAAELGACALVSLVLPLIVEVTKAVRRRA